MPVAGGSRGYAAEKMIKGRKRHILTDTIGLPVAMIVHRRSCRTVMARPLCWKAHAVWMPWLRPCSRMAATRAIS
jgi:putative transposase